MSYVKNWKFYKLAVRKFVFAQLIETLVLYIFWIEEIILHCYIVSLWVKWIYLIENRTVKNLINLSEIFFFPTSIYSCFPTHTCLCLRRLLLPSSSNRNCHFIVSLHTLQPFYKKVPINPNFANLHWLGSNI